jgi:hypothetical protein
VLAVVLAAVAVGGGWDVSGSCSRFVSVSLSLEGVKVIVGSEGGGSGVSLTDESTLGGLRGSVGGAGSRSSAVVSSTVDCGRADSCCGAGAVGGGFLATGAGLGFSKSLFQPETFPVGMASPFGSAAVVVETA